MTRPPLDSPASAPSSSSSDSQEGATSSGAGTRGAARGGGAGGGGPRGGGEARPHPPPASIDRRVWQMAFARAVNTMGLSLVMSFLGIYIVETRGYPAVLYGLLTAIANLC